jgi:hypothetical protein
MPVINKTKGSFSKKRLIGSLYHCVWGCERESTRERERILILGGCQLFLNIGRTASQFEQSYPVKRFFSDFSPSKTLGVSEVKLTLETLPQGLKCCGGKSWVHLALCIWERVTNEMCIIAVNLETKYILPCV